MSSITKTIITPSMNTFPLLIQIIIKALTLVTDYKALILTLKDNLRVHFHRKVLAYLVARKAQNLSKIQHQYLHQCVKCLRTFQWVENCLTESVKCKCVQQEKISSKDLWVWPLHKIFSKLRVPKITKVIKDKAPI